MLEDFQLFCGFYLVPTVSMFMPSVPFNSSVGSTGLIRQELIRQSPVIGFEGRVYGGKWVEES